MKNDIFLGLILIDLHNIISYKCIFRIFLLFNRVKNKISTFATSICVGNIIESFLRDFVCTSAWNFVMLSGHSRKRMLIFLCKSDRWPRKQRWCCLDRLCCIKEVLLFGTLDWIETSSFALIKLHYFFSLEYFITVDFFVASGSWIITPDILRFFNWWYSWCLSVCLKERIVREQSFNS